MTDTKTKVNEVNEVIETAEAVTAKAKKKRSLLARVGALCAVLAACACMALPVSATGGDGETSTANSNEIATTMSTAFTSVGSDLGNYALAVLPAGLGVFAITFCVRKGMGFFRTVAR